MFSAKGIIDGTPTEALQGHSYERRDSVTGAVVTRAAAFGASDAERAADAAAAAFPVWSAVPIAERARVLERAADCLGAARAALTEAACAETGCSPEWIAFNVEVGQGVLRQSAALCGAIGDRQHPGANGLRQRVVRRPAGVVLGLAPWNAPVTLAVRAVAAPLALGNTAVLKGSELCPKTHELVAQVFHQAGLPVGALSFVTNAPEQAHAVVEALIAHPAVRRVNFTGSTRVGREVAVMAARHLKRCLLELSGKGSTIVLGDADPAAAARVAVHGAFFNQGQVCMSTDRIIVEDSIAGPFLTCLKAEVERLRGTGDAAPLGRVISREAVARMQALVEDALAKGASLVTGGEVLDSVLQPTVLDHVAFGMRLYEEEVFGPIAGIIRVADAEEAVSVANDSDFGLAASVIGGDVARARAVARRIEVGIVHVNGSTVYDDPSMPFGGVKASGYGRFGGPMAIEEFTEVQWMTERDVPAAERLGG